MGVQYIRGNLCHCLTQCTSNWVLSFVVADDIKIGFGNRIPLWMFGLLCRFFLSKKDFSVFSFFPKKNSQSVQGTVSSHFSPNKATASCNKDLHYKTIPLASNTSLDTSLTSSWRYNIFQRLDESLQKFP